MMTRFACLVIPAAAIILAAPAVALPPEQQAVEKVMTDSAAGWNSGDLPRFMAVYSSAPETSFVTKEGVLRGKAVMSERYRTKYDFANAAKRGVLTFQTLDFRLLDPTHAIYIGRYTLTYSDGKTQSGPTILVFAKEAGEWKIIADHSS